MAQRRARTADRDKAVDTINNAYAEGQLSDSERNTRVGKALQARTLLQLERVTLDLQPPPPPPTEAAPTARPPSFRRQLSQNAVIQKNQWRDVPRWQKVLITVMALGCIGGLGAIAVLGDGPSSSSISANSSGGPAMTAKGLDSFIASYEDKFDSTRVVLASFAADQVTLSVPTADGKARHEEWVYSDGKFKKTADARRNGDEQGPIDLAAIDLSQLVANIADAKKTLDVEKPDQVLIWVEHEYRAGKPSVRIQVGNRFGEIGMLVTDLSGTTEIDRSPFKPASTS